jgi:hypothetical protein
MIRGWLPEASAHPVKQCPLNEAVPIPDLDLTVLSMRARL